MHLLSAFSLRPDAAADRACRGIYRPVLRVRKAGCRQA
jgi:hypothetical protein